MDSAQTSPEIPEGATEAPPKKTQIPPPDATDANTNREIPEGATETRPKKTAKTKIRQDATETTRKKTILDWFGEFNFFSFSLFVFSGRPNTDEKIHLEISGGLLGNARRTERGCQKILSQIGSSQQAWHIIDDHDAGRTNKRKKRRRESKGCQRPRGRKD